jgi:hypothetical protein
MRISLPGTSGKSAKCARVRFVGMVATERNGLDETEWADEQK